MTSAAGPVPSVAISVGTAATPSQLRAHAVEREPLELEHHHGPGGVLGERLVNAQRDLAARRHLAAEQMRLDQLVRDAAAPAQRRRYTATGSPHSRG
jgi:hypothetical protein